MKLHFPAALLTVLATYCLAPSAAALGTHIYGVNMSPAQEVPPPVSSGIGGCTVTLDDVTGLVTISGSYQTLNSNATAAHLHGLAPVGSNAGILIALTTTGGTSGNFSGSGTLSPTNVAGMLNGLTYVNVHTTSNPAGEIRGQVTVEIPSLSPAWVIALAMLAVGGGAFLLTRRAAHATA